MDRREVFVGEQFSEEAKDDGMVVAGFVKVAGVAAVDVITELSAVGVAPAFTTGSAA